MAKVSELKVGDLFIIPRDDLRLAEKFGSAAVTGIVRLGSARTRVEYEFVTGPWANRTAAAVTVASADWFPVLGNALERLATLDGGK